MDARNLMTALVFALLAGAGCRRESAPEPAADTGPLPAPAATMESSPPMAPAVQPATTLALGNADGIGAYLVDGQGRSLYAFSEDLGAPACHEACLQRWPALTVPIGEDVAVEAPVDAAQVGKYEREDGMLQATFGKHPLYTYVEDAAPGQRNGHDITDAFGHWSLVAPDGKPIAMKK